MTTKLSSLVVLILLFIACNSDSEKGQFFREDMLERYLAKNKELKNVGEYSLILANAADCGASCSIKGVNSCSQSSLFKSQKKKFVLINSQSSLMNDAFNQIGAKSIYEEILTLERYGLRLHSLYLFHIKNGELIQWEKIKEKSSGLAIE